MVCTATIICAIAISLIIIFCVKKSKTGNNIINQDNVKNIFNMKEYEAEIEVTITSNKNENKYKIKQKYNKEADESFQELLEPKELKGIKITRQGNTIKLENTELNLNKVFENYNITTQNDMDLDVFIKDYETNGGNITQNKTKGKNVDQTKESNSDSSEENEEIILETTSSNNNKYAKFKTLYINKKTGNPTKMEIKDMNKKDTVYIVYNKVEFK